MADVALRFQKPTRQTGWRERQAIWIRSGPGVAEAARRYSLVT